MVKTERSRMYRENFQEGSESSKHKYLCVVCVHMWMCRQTSTTVPFTTG